MMISSRKTIYCHPENLKLLAEYYGFPAKLLPLRIGYSVKASPHVPRFGRRWVPPNGRFWDCEQSDRAWCEPLGLGHWEDTAEPLFYVINNDSTLHHPQLTPLTMNLC